MKFPQPYHVLILIFACAIGIVMVLNNPQTTNAKGLSSNLFFNSPLHGGDDDNKGGGGGAPSPESKGELDPVNISVDKPVTDPEAPEFSVVFSPETVQEPIKIKFFKAGLPVNIPIPSPGIGSPFFFGVWSRIGTGTVDHLNHSIVISTPYDPASFNGTPAEQLRLYMYNPTLQSWIPLGGRVNPFDYTVTGMTTELPPFEWGGNTLFRLTTDEIQALEQSVDTFGMTTLSLPNRGFAVHILPGTVEVGTYFEATPLSIPPTIDTPPFLSAPIFIGAYYVNHQHHDYAEDHQITQFSKPINLEFDLTDVLDAQVEDPTRLTIMFLRNGEWVDLEELGYTVVRTEGKITLDTDQLGIFCLALK